MEYRLVFILNDLAFFMFAKVIQGHVRMKDEWSCISNSHCKCITSKGQSHRAKKNVFLELLLYFIHVTFQKKKNTGNLLCGPWKQLFSWLWIVVFISDCYRSPAAWNLRSRLQIPDCTVTYGFGDSHRAMKKKINTKENVKDLECKITNLRRRGAVRSARFSSVDFKGRPCSLPVCCTANCIRFVCFYLSVFALSLHNMRW